MIMASDFWPVFVALALIALIAPALHVKLAPDAGAAVSGHVVRTVR